MQVNYLHLQPYGSLADTKLELGAGLNVVYGLNEAGKSTLLSAYADLLCGIRGNTTMDVLVTKAKLKIAANITLEDGSVLELIRTTKRAPNDLIRTETSAPLGDELRQVLSKGLDHDSLLTRFGLNHQRLVEGGDQLIKCRGSLAEIIFEARSGTDVRVLVDQLQTQAAGLYTPRARSASKLIQANIQREALKSELKAMMATADAVELASRNLKEAEGELARCRLATEKLRRDVSKLDQFLGSWPYWEQYRARQAELVQAEAAGSRLSPNQLPKVTGALERLGEIESEIRHANSSAEEAQQAYSTLAVDEELLAAQPSVETLIKNQPGSDKARKDVVDLGKQAAIKTAEIVELLGRLGSFDVDQPLTSLASISVPQDRLTDLNDLADQNDRFEADRDEAQHAVNEGRERLQAAEAEAESTDALTDSSGEVDLAAVFSSRASRDELWAYLRGAWLEADPIPTEFGSNPADLADRYETSVDEADRAADEQIDHAGLLTEEHRKRIEVAAGRQATLNERRRELRSREQSLKKAQEEIEKWALRWHRSTAAAGLPPELGIPGWRQRVEILSAATDAAESLRALDRERAESAETVKKWNSSAASLAARLGQSLEQDEIEAWFGKLREDYDLAKSNRNVAALHLAEKSRAIECINGLREEEAALEKSLEDLASQYGVGRDGLSDLVKRTEDFDRAVVALAQPTDLLVARHPDIALDDLTNELATWDRDQLVVELQELKDSLTTAQSAENDAQEHAVEVKNHHRELIGRTGADMMRQEVSQATAQVLDIIEDYAITQLMHHLLTQELRTYLDSHRNPVLERAGTYLSRFTQGEYIGLRADGEGTDRSLVVIGADDADCETNQLSEGTASQLYLALSLAGVLEVEDERRQAGQERLPIMLDDILMAFDDKRTANALQLLAEIADGHQQQIVVFTHHASVKEQAEATSPTTRVVSLASKVSRG